MPTVAMVTVAIATEAEGQVARASNQGKFDLIRIYYTNKKYVLNMCFIYIFLLLINGEGHHPPFPFLY